MWKTKGVDRGIIDGKLVCREDGIDKALGDNH